MDIRISKTAQQGVMLLEALIGILIFSTGILALIGMQALAIGYMSDAKYRSDASFLANEIISEMWVDRGINLANLPNYAFPGGTAPALAAWSAKINAGPSSLPGATTDPLCNVAGPPKYKTEIVVTPGVGQTTVTVTLCWKLPNSTTARKYDTTTSIANP